MNDDQYVDIYSHIYWGYLRRLSCIIILSCSVFRYFFLFSSLRPQFLSLHDYFIFLIATRVLPRSSSFRTAAIPGFFFFFLVILVFLHFHLAFYWRKEKKQRDEEKNYYRNCFRVANNRIYHAITNERRITNNFNVNEVKFNCCLEDAKL